MHILFVNYEYPPLGGGGGIVNAWLAEELAHRHEVTVLTSRAFDLPAFEQIRGVEIIRSQTFFRRQMAAANIPSMAAFVISGAWRGRKLLQTRQFDVINTHFAVPTGPVGAYLSWLGDIPHVLSVHGGDLYDPSKWTSPHRHAILRSTIRQIGRRSDAVVCQSTNTNDNFRRYYDPGAEPRLIPLGVPRPPAPTESREALGLRPQETVMISIGRLVARKQTDQLLRLAGRLRNEAVRLVVVGDGPDLDALQRQANELDVADRVTFAGFVSSQRKVDLLAAADIYVSTSQHEGFGLVFLEAMSQGLPVVCYDHGGQTDFLQNGINGAVLPLNDLDGFTSAVGVLVTDPEKRKTIAERNKVDVERFYIESCAKQYEALFREVVDTNILATEPR
ncbi:MAG: glycosyltransferase family 4 protein [Woeseia sp.]